MKMADAGESKAAMQADRHRIVRVDAGKHDMLGAGGCAPQEVDHQRAPDPLAAAVRAHVDAVLDTVPIARPCPKLTEGTKAGDARCIPRHDHGKTMSHLVVEPNFAAGRRELLLRIDGGRIANDFVVDLENLRKIVAGRVVDHGLMSLTMVTCARVMFRAYIRPMSTG